MTVNSRTVELRGNRFNSFTDEEAVKLARLGDDHAGNLLIERYRDLVHLKVRPYFLIGADREDIVQEGMIGLYKAVRDYREQREASFKAFAELCITRQVITAVKTATRQKHAPLNKYISLNNPVSEENEPDRVIMDFIPSTGTLDPAELVISGEEADSMKSEFGSMLSSFEADVLRLYIQGRSYQQIAADLDRHVKSIDNALQRIKRKVERHLNNRERLAQGAAPKKSCSMAN